MTRIFSPISRRGLLLGAASLATVPAQALAPSLDFVVIGDWGRRGRWHQQEVAAQMGRSAAALGSQFVISVGDNIYPDGVASAADPQWQSSFEQIYTDPALMTPWHAILGNHDYQGDVEAQLAYASVSTRWHMPARYYTRTETLSDGTLVEFFFIDTSPFIEEYFGSRKVHIRGQNRRAQLAWLERALAASNAGWKIVVGHHQVFTVTGQRHDFAEMIGQFKPLLDRYGVRAYFNGHEHNMEHIAVDGVHYITCGAGSATSPVVTPPAGQFASDHHGFMTVQLGADTLRLACIDDTGATLYTANIFRNA
jgi:acid phosphatase